MDPKNNFHTSVLLHEAIGFLNVKKGAKYIDGTLGGGGHTVAIAELGGSVLGIDVDDAAIAHVELRIKNSPRAISDARRGERQELGERITLVRGNFRDIDQIAREKGFENVDGVLFDLGVSSHQFDEATRGFSLQREGPLDMRMDTSLSVKASDLVNALTKKELVVLLEKYGEERNARKIANAIVAVRSEKPIQTTNELSRVIMQASGRGGKIHPSTKVFQALRIAVNDELHAFEEALQKSVHLLSERGRVVVISFHSLEDRIAKHTFLSFAKDGLGMVLTEKPVLPGSEEIAKNPRARSAKLRAFERI